MTKQAYAFDIDGVLTNPQQKRVVHREIFNWLEAQLAAGVPIGLLTGRDVGFATKQIVHNIYRCLGHISELNLLYIVGEKGGVYSQYDKIGVQTTKVSDQYRIPSKLSKGVREIFNSQFNKSMFWDDAKRCMISIEYLDPEAGGKVSFETYKEEQKKLVKRLTDLIEDMDLTDQFLVDSSTIATDVQDRRMGKDLAAEVFLEIMKEDNLNPDTFICIGDSPSDKAMHDYLKDHGKSSTFVFVGEAHNLSTSKEDPEVLFTETNFGKNFDDGTLAFMQNQ